jgi:NAD(P)-dependent dehydrogenase (short-subunit alcohol dehydrogenase family)
MGIRDFYLNGKVAFIAGGRRGLGKAVALAFAEAGADVAVSDIITEGLEEAAEEIRKRGHRSLALPLDITLKADVEEAIHKVVDELGGIDILVNTAVKRTTRAYLIDLPEEDWDSMIDISLKGYFFTCQAAARQMITQGRGGSIINMASRSYVRPRERSGAYGSAKAGVVTLTGQLAMELGPYNIRANALAPSVVTTEWASVMTEDPERRKMVEAEIPLHRLCTPEELANVALFLASDGASYVSGVTIIVDGGSMWVGARNPAK